MCRKKTNVFTVILLAFAVLWFGFTTNAFPDQIKTIDDRVVEGKPFTLTESISLCGRKTAASASFSGASLALLRRMKRLL